MKKYLLYALTLIMSVMLVAGVAACTKKPEYSYGLSKTSMTLVEGSSEKLTVTVTPEKEISPEFSSDKKDIATVAEDGTVTAVAQGNAKITVTVDGEKLECAVTVTAKTTNPPAATEYDYALSLSKIELVEGKTSTLSVIVDPEKSITPEFTSDDTSIATVDKNSGLITAVAEGETVIKVSVDGKTLECTVKVSPKPVEYIYTLSETTKSLNLSEKLDLTVNATPAPAVMPGLHWSSSNDNIATVDGEGRVTAVGGGNATISVTIDGEDEPLTCAVTVSSPLTVGAASVKDIADQTVMLTDIDDTLDTLYWEHYQKVGENNRVNKKINVQSYVTESNALEQGGNFGDYKGSMEWYDGDVNLAWDGCHNGKHTSGGSEVIIKVKLTSAVSQIRVYTGAWKAVNTTSLWYNGVRIATAAAIEAGDDGVAREVTFTVELKTGEEEKSVEIRISAAGEGNASIVAVAVLGNLSATTALSMNKEEIVNNGSEKDPDTVINLTELGDKDWFVTNDDGQGLQAKDEKNGGTAILTDSYMGEKNPFWDYKASFTWTDGTTKGTCNSSDGGQNTHGENDGLCGSSIGIKVTVAQGDTVHLFVAGWKSTYHIAVLDSNGKLISDEKVADQIDGTKAYKVSYNVTESAGETLTFVVYRYTTAGGNCSLAAVAVSAQS